MSAMSNGWLVLESLRTRAMRLWTWSLILDSRLGSSLPEYWQKSESDGLISGGWAAYAVNHFGPKIIMNLIICCREYIVLLWVQSHAVVPRTSCESRPRCIDRSHQCRIISEKQIWTDPGRRTLLPLVSEVHTYLCITRPHHTSLTRLHRPS